MLVLIVCSDVSVTIVTLVGPCASSRSALNLLGNIFDIFSVNNVFDNHEMCGLMHADIISVIMLWLYIAPTGLLVGKLGCYLFSYTASVSVAETTICSSFENDKWCTVKQRTKSGSFYETRTRNRFVIFEKVITVQMLRLSSWNVAHRAKIGVQLLLTNVRITSQELKRTLPKVLLSPSTNLHTSHMKYKRVLRSGMHGPFGL